jgi:glycosyltransferase involved in cell wall biosynthesis
MIGSGSKQGVTPSLRILHVVPTYYPAVRYGGPIRSVHGLAAALVRRGHDVHVYTTSVDGDEDLDVPLGQSVDLDGVSVHYFQVPALRRLYWAPAMRAELRKSVADFDVVHLHSVFLWPMWAAARAAASAGVPYVISPRGMLMRDVIRQKSRLLKLTWIRLIERRTLASSAAVHVTAELESTELHALRLPATRIAQIPNGVERPSQRGPAQGSAFADLPERYGLFLSRISWKKGLDRLISAWRRVPDLALVIAGNDEEGYQSQLQELAVREGLANRVRFLGPVSDQDKWELYERAELFVLPSHSENFGNVVAEAMSVGCPVIVTPEVGIAPIVAEAAAGVICSNEPASLAEAISALHADAARRQQMGANGRRAANERLSWPAVASDMESLYRQICESSGARLIAHAHGA